MSNKKFNNRPNNGQNNPNPLNEALARNFNSNSNAVNNAGQDPVVRYGGKPKTKIYEYDITSRAVEDAVKDLFTAIDPEVSRNLVVMSASVNKRLYTMTIMFDPKTVTVGRKKNKSENTMLSMFEESNRGDGNDKRVQIRSDVASVLKLLMYTKADRAAMRSPASLKLFKTSEHQMRKFLAQTVPFRYSVNGREIVAIHVDPLKVFHYMLRDVRNQETMKDTNYTVVIRDVKLPSNDGEAIFTVHRRKTTRRQVSNNIDETVRRQMASTLTKRFATGGI